MPAGPHRPPLAIKLWLAQRFGRAGVANPLSAGGAGADEFKTFVSLEHVVRGRVRLFLRHTWLVTVLGTIVLGGAVWAGLYVTIKPTVMRIAASPTDAKLAHILALRLVQDGARIDLEPVSADGPKQSAEALQHGNADLAILPSTLANAPERAAVVAILRQNVMAFIVPSAGKGPAGKKAKAEKGAKGTKGAKAETEKPEKIQDLTGRRVSIVGGSEATADLLDLVLRHYGVTPGAVSTIEPDKVAEAVRAKQVDVLFVAGAATGKPMADAIAAATVDGAAPSFIAVDQADGIAKRDPALSSVDVEAGLFGGHPPSPDESFKTLGFAEYLVARKGSSHQRIAALAQSIYAARAALAAEAPDEIKIQAPSTDKDAAVIVHPGALTYLTDSQKSFFDRYGDSIFYGLLILPIFGSAVAAVAGYLRSHNRTHRLRLLQCVLDLTRKAHAASDLAAVDALQIEADKLVATIIHDCEHEDFDEAMKTSFSFALEQLRFAIASRRAVILEQAGGGAKSSAKAAAA